MTSLRPARSPTTVDACGAVWRAVLKCCGEGLGGILGEADVMPEVAGEEGRICRHDLVTNGDDVGGSAKTITERLAKPAAERAAERVAGGMECAAGEEQDAHALQMLRKPCAAKDTIGTCHIFASCSHGSVMARGQE